MNLTFSRDESPKPGVEWLAMEEWHRLAKVNACLQGSNVQAIHAAANGVVVLKLADDLSVETRGSLLRVLEDRLQQRLDKALLVYLEPLDDRNAVRRFRGVKL